MGHCGGDDDGKQYVQHPPLCFHVHWFSPWDCDSRIDPFLFSLFRPTSTALTYTPTAFKGASAFNADVSKWVTAAVTSMDSSTFNLHLCVHLFNGLFHENVVP